MAKVRLRWKNPKDSKYAYAKIYISVNYADYELDGSTAGETYLIEDLPVGANIDISVVSVSKTGAHKGPTNGAIYAITCREEFDTPTAPTNFYVSQKEGKLLFSWDENTDKLFDHYELRRGSSWAGGLVLSDNIKDNKYEWDWQVSGTTQAFYLKAVDKYGKVSGTVEKSIYVNQLENSTNYT